MTLNDLKLRLRALFAPRRMERDLDDELAFHIEREAQKHIEKGLEPAEARRRARQHFGSAALAADECRDARGITFASSVGRDILYALRAFRRAPLTALTIVTTVALGLGLVAAVFTLYNVFFLRADAVRNPHELYAVDRLVRPGAGAFVPFMRPDYEALRAETSVFTDVFAILRGVSTRIEGRAMRGALVSGNFFDVLGVQAALGRTLTPADDERFAARPVIVLSHRGWSTRFAGDPDVVGRRVPIYDVPYEVVGVMPESFRGLGIGPPDYWAPLGLVGQLRPSDAGREEEVWIDVVGRLAPGTSSETATAALTAWVSGRTSLDAASDGQAHIRLTPSPGTLRADMLESLLVFAPIFFAFGLVLMIGCANVANLLLARGVLRQREIGIRLSIGASRLRIVRQLLTESLILALASAACGYIVSRLFLEGALYAAISTMPPEFAELVNVAAPAADWRVFVFLLAGAIASTVFFGLLPALQATRLELVRTMRGEVTREGRPGRARYILIAAQVGASALLLICAAVFLRSAFASATSDPGVRTSDTVVIAVSNEPRRPSLLQELVSHPSVAIVAASSSQAQATAYGVDPSTSEDQRSANHVPVDYTFVSRDFFDVLGVDVVRGRVFSPAERTADAGVVIVSDTFARRLWPDRDAVGQVVRLDAWESNASSVQSGPFTVVGVVRDARSGFRLSGISSFTSSGVYLPAAAERPGMSLMLRVHGDPELARRALLDSLIRLDPSFGEIRTMRTLAGLDTYILQIAFWVTVVVGGLALVLTVSGLFSVLSYVTEQRRKEIGVRMALGATPRNISTLVLSQSLRPVLTGLAIGGGLAAALAAVLMATPAASQIGEVVRVLDPVAYVASLLVIVAACVLAASIPARRAARIDPIASLRDS